ncbi:hypothetical protein C478_17946 [Natrinema thermotolerans DSM 11552]|nr:hypothetical protein C478_17946 [Natrinema thermotolerans DSM 11552]
MEAFRERQQERPTEVPTDIERRHNKSVQRSRGAHNAPSRDGDTQVPDSVRDVISSPGQQLDTSIQRAMEARMGDSLGDVRIHTGPQAASACEDINARAFTVGNHVAFNHGEYDPESAEGQHVLAHELAHVRQQTGGAISMLPQEGTLEIDPDERLEREAEETAQRVMRGGKIGVHRMRKSEVHVQRMPDAEHLEQAREQVAADSDHLTLAEEVSQIKDRLSSVEAAVGGESTLDSVGKAVSQGAVGAVGGLLGAIGGTMVSPGVGTIGGAAVGQEVAKGVAGDVTKTLTGKAYERGTETVSELATKANTQIEQLVEQTVTDLLGKSDNGGVSQGVGKGGNV